MAKASDNLEILKLVMTGMNEKYLTFDLDGDGVITNQEFRLVLEEMVGEPCPEEDWTDFISKVDYDNSGTIGFDEFLYALYLWFADDGAEETSDDEKDEVDTAFALLKSHFREKDVNAVDSISKADFINILSKLKDSQVQETSIQKVFEGMKLNSNQVTFKKYLYGVYLFVTQQ